MGRVDAFSSGGRIATRESLAGVAGWSVSLGVSGRRRSLRHGTPRATPREGSRQLAVRTASISRACSHVLSRVRVTSILIRPWNEPLGGLRNGEAWSRS